MMCKIARVSTEQAGVTQYRMPGPQRREQILDVCRDIVAIEGYSAATINRVAADSGVTRTVIYQQFGGHVGMLIALIDREAERAARGFAAAITENPAAQHTFPDAMAGVLAAVDADPATWRMCLMPSEGAPPELYERLDQDRATVRAYITDVIRAHTQAADIADVELAARTLHAAADEIVRLHLTDPKTYTTQRLVAHTAELTRNWLHQTHDAR